MIKKDKMQNSRGEQLKKLCYKQLETANTDRWQQAIRKIEKNGIN